MSKMNAAAYKARLLEFADFMEKLPPEKFDHTTWCTPDHTCKTSACVAGWAVINYSRFGKLYLQYEFESQRVEEQIDNAPDDISDYRRELLYNRMCRLDDKADNVLPDWGEAGKKILGFDDRTGDELFVPGSTFWYRPDRYGATPQEVALTMRYLAYKPRRQLDKGEVFNAERMQAYINHAKAAEAARGAA